MTPNTQGASWEKEFDEKYAIREVGEYSEQLIPNSSVGEPIKAFIRTLLSKERAEGERRGRNEAVDYIEKKIGRYGGADRFVFLSNNFSYVCKEARTLPADSTEDV